jgi:hypothetical protein
MYAILALPLLVVMGQIATEKPHTTIPTSTSTSTSETHSIAAPVKIGETGVIVVEEGYNAVAVWKNTTAMSDYWSLKKAGADARLLAGKISCTVPAGTRIMATVGEDGAFWSGLTSTTGVLVLSGPHAGCRGTVTNDELRKE